MSPASAGDLRELLGSGVRHDRAVGEGQEVVGALHEEAARCEPAVAGHAEAEDRGADDGRAGAEAPGNACVGAAEAHVDRAEHQGIAQQLTRAGFVDLGEVGAREVRVDTPLDPHRVVDVHDLHAVGDRLVRRWLDEHRLHHALVEEQRERFVHASVGGVAEQHTGR